MSENEWTSWWDARLRAMEKVLGPSDDVVGHALVPFDLGADVGGAADIVYFRQHQPGVGYATCELIGRDDQVPSALGNYELLIFHRSDDDWGPNLISQLALYTCEAALNPGETMELGSSLPGDATVSAFLFLEYARFKVRRRRAGLLLCIGITPAELAACRAGRLREVQGALRAAGIYPFTDLRRESVL